MTVNTRLVRLLALPLAFVAGARAQTAVTPPAAPPAAPAAPSQDVVRLSEFNVSSKTVGYSASETMTGSRVNTPIVDLPYSIVNLTDEFFKDYGITILDENMTYIGGLTGINIGGSFNLRGFSSTSQLRDGFYRLGRYGLSNISRVEIIRGPNAAIYGRSSPGGMINFVSLQPSKETQQNLTLLDGSYKQQQGALNLTGSLDKEGKTYYVAEFDQTSRDYTGQYDAIHNNEDFVAIEHDFDDSSHLKVSAEYFLQIQHAPQQAAQVVSVARTATPDNTATSTALGLDLGLASVNPYGPNSELNRGSITYTGTYDKAFNDVWSIRTGVYNFRARRWDYNQNTGWGSITIPLNGGPVTSSRGSLPSRGEIMEDGGGFQQDLLAHYFLFNHTVENNTLFTVDFNDYYRWDPTWEYSVNSDPDITAWSAPRTVTLVPTSFNGTVQYMPAATVPYVPHWFTYSKLTLLSATPTATSGAVNGGTLTRRRTDSIGGNLRQQMFFFDQRLIAYAGLRNDTVLFSQRDYTVPFASVGFANDAPANTAGASVVRRYEHQNKPNMGFNYAVTKDKNLHVYGSYSTAYFVDQTSRPAVIAASTYAPFTAKGYDYGLKGSYFNQRLNFTLGGYYDKEFNVLVNDTIEQPPGSGNFVDVAEQDGDQLVRGFEADLNWAVTDNFWIGGSGAEVNALYTNLGSEFPEVKGRSVQNISPENGSIYSKYNLSLGKFGAIQFNPLVTYVSSTPAFAGNQGDTTTINKATGTSVLTAHTDQWKIRYPSFILWNLDVTYTLPRISPYWDQTISLYFNNIFNKVYLKIPTGSLGDGREIMIAYTVGHHRGH
jgi:iron complex outermembrane receptor protein